MQSIYSIIGANTALDAARRLSSVWYPALTTPYWQSLSARARVLKIIPGLCDMAEELKSRKRLRDARGVMHTLKGIGKPLIIHLSIEVGNSALLPGSYSLYAERATKNSTEGVLTARAGKSRFYPIPFGLWR
ncbi:hypothetical protein ARSEF4850_009066 [Beauveria asiatica]